MYNKYIQSEMSAHILWCVCVCVCVCVVCVCVCVYIYIHISYKYSRQAQGDLDLDNFLIEFVCGLVGLFNEEHHLRKAPGSCGDSGAVTE